MEAAEEILKRPEVLHLLVLDLGLPLESGGEAMEGIEPGIGLLKKAAGRDGYPVPAVVVISGRLGAAKLPDLQERLSYSFWHGTLVNKGVDEDTEIEKAIEAIHRYCDVGIHIRDAGSRLCPTLSPREEDMLRRCVLSQEACIGLDLGWWGDHGPYPIAIAEGAPSDTKVLEGRFILDEARGVSQTSFFKFCNPNGAAHTRTDAGIMAQKLNHIKVLDANVSFSRSLLVTQKVGVSENAPISLSDYLRRDPEIVQPQIPQIVAEINLQLHRLGESDMQPWPANRLVWEYHDRETIVQAVSEFGSEVEAPIKPEEMLEIFDALCSNEKQVFVRIRPCTHGDLNATNVALDENDGKVEAYVFDAEGVHPDVDIRDLAMLEITSLLHHALNDGDSLVVPCADLYDDFVVPPDDFDVTIGPHLVQNTRRLIAEIRRLALPEESDQAVYAAVAFDVALQQLGGLVLQRSGNKIILPKDAAILACHTASWCKRFLSDL